MLEFISNTGVPKMGQRFKDMTGKRFGRLTIIERVPNYRNAAKWRYRCDCGNEGTATGGSLRLGTTKSCGCLRKEIIKETNTKHGHTWAGGSTSTYKSWRSMSGRCNNPNHHKYHLYGALGVKMCDRWSKFENFMEDMGERPEGTTIDRYPDQSGTYCKENCRWATITEQNNNKKTNVHIEYNHIVMTVGDAVRLSGSTVKRLVVYKRIKRGWSIDDALNTPVR